MECTFYRPKTVSISEFFDIRYKLEADLAELETGRVPEKEAVRYLEQLLPQAEPLEKKPAMRFFGLEKPDQMPSDARVDFFYWPTYLAAMLAMKAILLYPGLPEKIRLPGDEDLEQVLRAVLYGCTGRGFRGHGIEDVSGLVEVTGFFTEHGAGEFLKKYGGKCPEFAECCDQALLFLFEGVWKGAVAGIWGDDYTEGARSILKAAGMPMPEDQTERLYLAYGSNLNRKQMHIRCPDALISGTAELRDWRLKFKGSKTGNYLTVEQEERCRVPVAVWAVSGQDEKNLDRYEGCPDFYYKKELPVMMRERDGGGKKPVIAFLYIMHERRRLGLPTERYMECCREGYRDFGFDEGLLDEAYAFSGKK